MTDPTKYSALKRIRMESEKEGFPVTAAREIKLLRAMNHPNIVRLECICTSVLEVDSGIYLVFEYLEHDLAGLLLQSKRVFSLADCCLIVREILTGLVYLHSHGIIHRDIKASNVLISRDGRVKLADFGLARSIRLPEAIENIHPVMTNRVVTLWYRPPEILLGSTSYGPEADLWGVGCILWELLTGRPPFTGTDELSQVEAIVGLLGRIPTDSNSSSNKHYPWLTGIFEPVMRLNNECTTAKDAFLAAASGNLQMDSETSSLILNLLLEGLLCLDPTKRITAAEALEHPLFAHFSGQRILSLGDEVDDCHEYDCKQRRKAAAAHA